jgi:hypothetical protein
MDSACTGRQLDTVLSELAPASRSLLDPPGLFTDKWVLLQTPNSAQIGCIHSLILDYETIEGGRERVLLPFRDRAEESEWQALECRRRNDSAPAAAETRGLAR